MRGTADDTIIYSPHRTQSTGESQGKDMSKVICPEPGSQMTNSSSTIPTWRERLGDTCTYPEMTRAMQAQIDDLLAALATEERYWPRFSIRLASPGHVQPGRTTVDVEIGGNWIPLISEAGDVFCHIIEPAGIEAILAKPIREAIRALKKEG